MLRALFLLIVGFCVGLVALVAFGIGALRTAGVGARGHEPGFIETAIAREARSFAIPATARTKSNPVPDSADAVAEGMAHFADHCASCHANDGTGNTEMGRAFYPNVPDMRLPATQALSDGELFYIIENGVRFTGMPGWGTGTAAGEESSWRLVRFIRHLPRLTDKERAAMEAMNPRPPEEVRQEIEEERFLNQGVNP